LVGGATGRVGDPSGKTQERQLLSVEDIERNLEAVKKQLESFLDFGDGPTDAITVNNYDWFKDITFLDFIRDAGKHISINYMLAKDSVKTRLESGMSFTEFTYQLIQGYDFYHLNKEMGVKLQMGGSDQWGNITTGTELTRRMGGGDAFALTAPLVKKADGSKFGKSEGGNVWLDAEKTSAYQFYQFWFNATDEDVENFIKVFSLKSREEIESLISSHREEPHNRILQKDLAAELTERIHGKAALDGAIEASNILFGKSTAKNLQALSERDFLDVFSGVEQAEVSRSLISEGTTIVDFLSESTGFLKSKGEARRALKENSISVNKEKVSDEYTVSTEDLIQDRYILLQRGKKTYFIAKAV